MNGGGDGLAVAGLSLRLGAFALHDIALRAGAGEVLAILGPNGAGKSVTLETIAGFHRPRTGRIAIAGREVGGLPPERRGVSLVPQNYGLFPHLTVAANVALPLRRRPQSGHVAALLARFGIAPLADRLPADLSPGEKQRAALARALAARPLLFLFDEPFAALDAATRDRLREELRAFLGDSGIPAVFVTHDLGEALGLADRLAVMAGGRIVQQGRADEVYRAPADREAAGLLGVENLLAARVLGRDDDGAWQVAVGEALVRAGAANGGGGAPRPAALAIRAEDVAVWPADAAPPADAGRANRIAATIRAVAPGGALVKVSLDCGGGLALAARLASREARSLTLAPGQAAIAEIMPEAIRLL